MKIDDMMAEIRREYSSAHLHQPGPRCEWTVYSDSHKDSYLSRAIHRRGAVLVAYRAVRKARPKPMTVAQAKAAVKAKYPKARSGWGTLAFEKDPAWYIFPLAGDRYLGTKSPTEGQAWKAAAVAIAAKDGQ